MTPFFLLQMYNFGRRVMPEISFKNHHLLFHQPLWLPNKGNRRHCLFWGLSTLPNKELSAFGSIRSNCLFLNQPSTLQINRGSRQKRRLVELIWPWKVCWRFLQPIKIICTSRKSSHTTNFRNIKLEEIEIPSPFHRLE